MSNITPFVKRMRTVGGTIYVFSSATEDIGLNISERNNEVRMSNYALLNIPDISNRNPLYPNKNNFNVLAIQGAFKSFNDNPGNTKDGGVLVAESFQNYALNLEANLIDTSTYDPKLSTTVSERVFWKWLKETGAIRWEKDGSIYWKEESNVPNGYNDIVQGIGEITAGAIRYDGYGSYNETYVLVPSTYGKTNIRFKQVEDANYKHGIIIPSGDENILGREDYTVPHPDALDYTAYYDVMQDASKNGTYNIFYDNKPGWWTTAEGITHTPNSYYTDTNAYITDGSLNNVLKYVGAETIEFKRSKVDCMSIEYDLRKLYGDASAYTFDDISTKPMTIGESYNFNAILIYYSVYANKTAVAPISTNLLGVLFLDNAVGKTSSVNINYLDPIIISRTKKIQGGNSIVGSTGFGTSYSFRLNIKTDNMFDDTQATIYDNSEATTSEEEAQRLISALEQSVNTLNKHSKTINYISNQYVGIASQQNDILNSVVDLQQSVNGISIKNISGTPNRIPVWQNSTSVPLIDSSLYVINSKVGLNTTIPTYDFHVNGSIGTNDLYVNNAIKDFNGNVLFESGSYLTTGPFVKEASLGITFKWVVGVLDVSISSQDLTTINNTLIYHDSSIKQLDSIKLDKAQFIADFSAYVPNASMGPTLALNPQNKYDVSIGIANYALISNVDAQLSLKANKIYVDGSLNVKSNISYVDASLNAKSSITDVSAALILKADKIYVDGSLNVKSNISYVDASLLKRDTSINDLYLYTDASLLKRDTSINDLYSYVTDLSTRMSYVNTNSVLCTLDTSTYLVIGNKFSDRAIILDYTIDRHPTYRTGEIRILNSSTASYLTDTYQETGGDISTNLAGVVFSTTITDPSINLIIHTNLISGVIPIFKYTKRIIPV